MMMQMFFLLIKKYKYVRLDKCHLNLTNDTKEAFNGEKSTVISFLFLLLLLVFYYEFFSLNNLIFNCLQFTRENAIIFLSG